MCVIIHISVLKIIRIASPPCNQRAAACFRFASLDDRPPAGESAVSQWWYQYRPMPTRLDQVTVDSSLVFIIEESGYGFDPVCCSNDALKRCFLNSVKQNVTCEFISANVLNFYLKDDEQQPKLCGRCWKWAVFVRKVKTFYLIWGDKCATMQSTQSWMEQMSSFVIDPALWVFTGPKPRVTKWRRHFMRPNAQRDGYGMKKKKKRHQLKVPSGSASL